MELNKYDLFRALSDVDEDLLADADQTPKRRQTVRRLLPLAASCAALVVLAIFSFGIGQKGEDTAVPMNLSQETGSKSGERSESFLAESQEIPSRFAQADPALSGYETSAPAADADSPSAQDFSFSISWPGGSYDSSTGLLTRPEGEAVSRPLTSQELQTAWHLLSDLPMTENRTGELALTVTQNGETQTVKASLEEESTILSVCTELIRLVGGEIDR